MTLCLREGIVVETEQAHGAAHPGLSDYAIMFIAPDAGYLGLTLSSERAWPALCHLGAFGKNNCSPLIL